MTKTTTLPISVKHAVIACIVILVVVLFLNGFKGSWSRVEQIDPFIEFAFDGTPQPDTQESEGESICRSFLTKILKVPFNKARPNFLRNPVTSSSSSSSSSSVNQKGHNLEIDCFNEALALGVEYNGRQHYAYVPHFHKNFEAFRNQQYRDELKRRMCRDNGIHLIEVPYTTKNKDIPLFLHKQLKALDMV